MKLGDFIESMPEGEEKEWALEMFYPPLAPVIVDEMKWIDQDIAEALHRVKETKEREGE